MTGPPPGPTERKRRRGNPGKRPLPEPVVLLPAAESPPDPPQTLTKSGRELWHQLWTIGSVWLSPESDGPAVAMLCESFDQRTQIQQGIDEMGLFIQRGDEVVVNPAVNHLRKVNAEIIRLLSSLGMTPTDRARMGLAEVKRVSELQKFLGGKS